MQRFLPPLVLLAALGLGLALLWSLWPSAEEPVRRPGQEGGAAAPAAREGPALQARRGTPDAGAPDQGAALCGRVTRGSAPVPALVELYALGTVPHARTAWREDPEVWRNAARTLSAVRPLAQTTCGGDGRFQFAHLAGGLYRVVARHEGRRGSTPSVFLHADGRRVEVDIALAGGAATLSGRVRFEDGRPWQGQVRATPTYDRKWFCGPLPGDAPGVATDPDGRFTLTALPLGPLRLQALDPNGMRVLSDRIWIPYTSETELVVPNPESWARLRVAAAEDGRPIVGATILAAGYSRRPGSDVFLEARTDAEGRAQVPVGKEYVSVRVEAAGWALADVTVYRGEPDTLITLSRSGAVHGSVVDKESGAPVAGLTILTATGASAITDHVGHFELSDVPAGHTQLEAAGEGWLPWSLEGVDGGGWGVYPVAAATHIVRLVAWRGIEWKGVVQTPAGEPVAGATVYAHPANGEDDLSSAVAATGRTGDDGRIALAGLKPKQKYGFRAEVAGYAASVSAQWYASAENATSETTITLRRGRSVVVEVTDEGGSPLPGIRIACKGDEPSWTYRVTDGAGVASVEGLPPSRLWLWARSEGYEVHTEEVPPAAEGEEGPQTVRVTLGPAGTVTGRVLWADGSPADGQLVKARGLDQKDSDKQESERTTRTNEEGDFRFDWMPAGAHLLRTSARHTDPKEVAEARVAHDEQGVVLQFRCDPPVAGPTVELQVLDARGQPVPYADVTYRDATNEYEENEGHEQATVRNGTCTLSAWSHLVVHGAASSTGAPLPLATFTAGPHDGTTPYTIRMQPELVLSGRLRGEDGTPLGGARLSVTGDGQIEADVRTDALGTFRIGRLAPGAVTLQAFSSQGHLGAGFALQAGDTDLDLVLRREADVRIRVLDPEGRPLPGAQITWLPSDGNANPGPGSGGSGRLATDAAGELRMPYLDPRLLYDLALSPPDATEEDMLSTKLPGWRPADTEIRLAPGESIQGLVLDAGGAPAPNMQVVGWQEATDQYGWAQSDAEGRFELKGFRPGRVTVWAGRENESDPWRAEDNDARNLSAVRSEEVTVSSGARGVRLHVDLGLPLRIRVRGWDHDADQSVRAVLTLETPEHADDAELAGSGETPEGKRYFAVSANLYGHFSFAQARPGARFTLWIGPLSGGRYVLRTGLVGRTAPYEVTPQRGGVVRGSVEGPAGVTPSEAVMIWGDGFFAQAKVDAHGAFEVAGLPPGRIRVTATGKGAAKKGADPWGQDDYRGVAEGNVGASLTVQLREVESADGLPELR